MMTSRDQGLTGAKLCVGKSELPTINATMSSAEFVKQLKIKTGACAR
jgi:hypothetical protein